MHEVNKTSFLAAEMQIRECQNPDALEVVFEASRSSPQKHRLYGIIVLAIDTGWLTVTH